MSGELDILIEPHHDKTYKMTRAPSEDSDQPEHPPSLTRVFACAHWVAKDQMILHADSEDSAFVGYVMRRLLYEPGHSKTYTRVHATKTRTPPPFHTHTESLISLHCKHEEALDPWLSIGLMTVHRVHSKDSDQTSRIRRLI